jgi:hypothetical protein
MGFRQGAYAKVWRVEDKGNYSVAQISISRKKKDSDQYETEFQNNFVRFVGTAHDLGKDIPEVQGGTSIKITSCDVTNKYDKEAKKEYTNFVIFGFEFPDNNNGKSGTTSNKKSAASKKNTNKPADNGFMNIPDGIDSEELPFN